MTVERSCWLAAAVGAVSAGLLLLGFGNVGGLVALVQQCLLVGLPLTLVLGLSHLRTWRALVAISFAVSLAVSAVSAQILVWFEVASGPLLVATATVYGLVLAWVAQGATTGRRQVAEQVSEVRR